MDSAAVVFLIIILFLIWMGPIGFIWAVNTLFNVGIAYTFKNWLASLVLLFLVQGSGSKSSK